MHRWKFMRLVGPWMLALFAAVSVAALAMRDGHAEQAPPAADATSLLVVDAAGRRQVLTEARLLALSRATLSTRTAWTEGPRVFDGVLLKEVLAAAGIDPAAPGGRFIEATALNDYQVLIPFDDVLAYDIVVARFMDGQALTRRDKGPYWIVYPRDRHSELADSRYDHRWVWQLRQLRIQ